MPGDIARAGTGVVDVAGAKATTNYGLGSNGVRETNARRKVKPLRIDEGLA